VNLHPAYLTIHVASRVIKKVTSRNAKNVKNLIQFFPTFSSQRLNSVSRTDIVTDALSNEIECSNRKASPVRKKT